MDLYLLARIVFTEEAENHGGLYKGGFMSESTGRFSNCPKNVGAENYPELLHSHGNDKILILNNILKFKNCHSVKIYLKNANDTAYVECVKCFKTYRIIHNAPRTYLLNL